MAKRDVAAKDNKETSSSSPLPPSSSTSEVNSDSANDQASPSSSSSSSEVKVKIEQIDQLERTGGSKKPVDVLGDSPPSPEELAQVVLVLL